jgi:hypothetical protein
MRLIELSERRGDGYANRMRVDLEQGIDKRGNGRTLGKDHQASEQQQHQDHWGEPPPLALPEKLQQVTGDT